MCEKKHSDNYVKAICTMISRGDILNLDTLLTYFEYIDFNKHIKIDYLELEMLFGPNNIDKINPKYYAYSSNNKDIYYAPIDLILYACIYNNLHYYSKKSLIQDIIKLDFIDFSNITNSLKYTISEGDLELFNIFMSLKPSLNLVSSYLRNGEECSVLDDCISLALARLTISDYDIFYNYPKEILDILLAVDKNSIDFDLLRSTRIIATSLIEVSNIENIYKSLKDETNDKLFEDISIFVENYRNYKIEKYGKLF